MPPPRPRSAQLIPGILSPAPKPNAIDAAVHATNNSCAKPEGTKPAGTKTDGTRGAIASIITSQLTGTEPGGGSYGQSGPTPTASSSTRRVG